MKRATKIFLSAIVLTLAMLQPRTASAQKIDTLEVSTLYTTYIRFPKELLTAERSDSENIIGEIVQESKNIVRLRATKPFTRMSNLTVIDSEGYLYTCYIKYCEHPATTYYDKTSAAPATDEQSKTNVESGAIMWNKYPDVPFPKETNDEDIQLLLMVDIIRMPYLTATMNKGTLFCFSTFGYPESPWTTLPSGVTITA